MSEAKQVLTMYHRIGCHLCEQMAASLYALQEELNFTVELVDIDKDEVLRERYNVDVPVVTYQNEVIFYHFFEEASLRDALRHDSDSKETTGS